MDESNKNSPCKECRDGVDDQLHKEVDHLRQHLADRDAHFVALETEFFKSNARADELEEQVGTWQEKYERLYDSHRRVQILNQDLEDKLLHMVDKMKTEKSQLTKDIATLSVRLAESKHNYSMLQKENERYKNDMNLAIQLLQCKPDNFVSHKLDNLPVDTQARVSQYVMSKTTPKATTPTQSKAGNDIDTFDASEYEFNISASLMSKILEDSIQDSVTKHCDTCTCSKSQNKPFCYNDSYYSTSTQTHLSGDINNSLCSHCNAEIKSMHSILSIRSESPHGVTIVNEKVMSKSPLYILPQPEKIDSASNVEPTGTTEIISSINVPNNVIKTEDTLEYDLNMHKDAIQKLDDEYIIKKANSMSMEPAVHHKLCDRTRTSVSSKKSSILSVGNEDLIIKEFTNKDVKPKNHQISLEINNQAKGSHSSMGACSRTSSIAKSTVSTHKSHTQVGPGPRFCHLRVQAGSKNILLDNAEPDVPPVLYRRQSKCHDNSIFKDMNDELDNFIDLEKNEVDGKVEIKSDNFVVETTLIDVHVDNNNKEASLEVKNGSINPVLLNVSSSPLQPLKTHNFLKNAEYNNNNSQIESQQCRSEIDTLLNDFNVDTKDPLENINKTKEPKQNEVLTPNSSQEIKIFNFDRYEQSQVDSQYTRPMKKIDMSKLHSIENTRISKDIPPQGEFDKDVPQKPSTPNIVNVYPNLTQTHLKTNENKNHFTNEQSTSSMSSDDSAAMLQKQQLLRVAEWVEKNLEQQNLNDPLEEESSYSKRATRRESKISRLTETLNELALNMPHPVSKYSKSYSQKPRNNWIHNSVKTQSVNLDQIHKQIQNPKIVSNVVKETIFPVECDEDTVTEINPSKVINHTDFDIERDLRDVLKAQGKDKTITPEDLARMEYNVKKFLLSGPYWANPGSVGRSRRTSSKTETDV